MEEEFRNRISTVNEKGKRVWVFPKKPKGKWTTRRQIISYLLLAFLFLAPYIHINGEPLLLFNILERKFVIFGAIFWPQDFYLLAIFLIASIVSVILFTIIYGRIFCGWICPQTIFMEFVFRRIEYLIEGDWTNQKKLKGMPWNREKITKKTIKYVLFWIVSFLIANTFLSYIIGAEKLWGLIFDPVNQHIGGLISIVIFTSVFFFVFAHLREQVCTTICPYGRLQGVLLDPNSMVVAYDHVRGENRAKFKKGEDRPAANKGACIDCLQCIHVCPTGIDIRNGTQLECINCTACIDACDTMMIGTQQETGLIRFVSENGIKNRTGFEWTKRVKAYTVALFVFIGVLVTLLVMRDDFSTTIMRQRGSTFVLTDDNQIVNTFEIDLSNKTKLDYAVQLKCDDPKVKIEIANTALRLKKEKFLKERFIIKTPYSNIHDGMKKVNIIVYGNGEEIDRVRIKIIGPNF